MNEPKTDFAAQTADEKRRALQSEVTDLAHRVFTYLTTVERPEIVRLLVSNGQIDAHILGADAFQVFTTYQTYKDSNPDGSFKSFCNTLPQDEADVVEGLLLCDKAPPDTPEDFDLLVKQLAAKRTQLDYFCELLKQLRQETYSPADAEKLARPFSHSRAADRMTRQSVIELARDIVEQYKHSDRLYIPSGYGIFDSHVHGYRRGGITTIAGRPGSGKTLWATSSAAWQIMQGAANVLFISTEMSDMDIMERIITASANMAPNSYLKCSTHLQFETGNIANREIEWFNAVGKFSQHAIEGENAGRFELYADEGITIDDIESYVMSAAARTRLDVIFVDYWQNIRGGEGRQEWERLQNIAQRLALLARHYNAAIVCLAQLRRAQSGEDTKYSHPSTDDIRGSDMLAQISVAVTCLSSYNADDQGFHYKFYAADIVKSRHGTLGLIEQLLLGNVGLLVEKCECDEWPAKYFEKKGGSGGWK